MRCKTKRKRALQHEAELRGLTLSEYLLTCAEQIAHPSSARALRLAIKSQLTLPATDAPAAEQLELFSQPKTEVSDV